MAHERHGSMGAGGACVCLKCGHREEHRPGVPCMDVRCPQCGATLLREGSPHHQEALARRRAKEDPAPETAAGAHPDPGD